MSVHIMIQQFIKLCLHRQKSTISKISAISGKTKNPGFFSLMFMVKFYSCGTAMRQSHIMFLFPTSHGPTITHLLFKSKFTFMFITQHIKYNHVPILPSCASHHSASGLYTFCSLAVIDVFIKHLHSSTTPARSVTIPFSYL